MNAHRLLIATDLDRTLLPNGAEAESPGAREMFGRLVSRPEVTLAYVSGRHRGLVEEAIVEYGLPQPDFVIGDVGTSMYQVDAPGQWSQPTGWEQRIAADWGGHDATVLAAWLEDVPELELQPADRQNRCKLSYFVPLDWRPDRSAPAIQSRLEANGIKARLVWSIDEPAATGLLDVLPEQASKLHALEALMASQAFSAENTVFCGDSGNDLEVLVSAVPAVLVANAQPGVRLEARRRAEQSGWPRKLYLARGGFMGLNGNYSAGMLEGIAHFQPMVSDWLGAPESG